MCAGADKTVEIWRVRTAAEVKKKVKRKLKRRREKGKDDADADLPVSDQPTPSDIFSAMLPLRTHQKITSFGVARPTENLSEKAERVVVSLSNNCLATYDVDFDNAESPYTRTQKLELLGHRTGVRSVCLNKDDTVIMTTSADQLKLWNTRSRNCIRTLDSGYGLCCMFAPGGRHAVVGTKDGHLELYDLSAAALVQKVKAHDGSVWSLDMRPDGKGFASGGSDCSAKCWDFELAQGESESRKQLAVVHTRTLKLTDDVLCVKHSPDGRYLAVSLLDCTVKVF
eukprot:874914_1